MDRITPRFCCCPVKPRLDDTSLRRTGCFLLRHFCLKFEQAFTLRSYEGACNSRKTTFKSNIECVNKLNMSTFLATHTKKNPPLQHFSLRWPEKTWTHKERRVKHTWTQRYSASVLFIVDTHSSQRSGLCH